MVRKGWKKKLLPVAVMSAVALGSLQGSLSNVEAAQGGKNQAKIKNVIVLIGDGMGPAYTTAYRYLKDDPSTPLMEDTGFDPYLVGMQSVNPHDDDENITDSAAAATSMAAGIKTYNGAISVDRKGQEVETVLELAKEQSKSTGLVSTSQVNHATPAAFGAHDKSRHNYNDIADDYYDEMINGKHKIDVILGGGTNYFVREDRNLAKEFQNDGYSYVTNREELLNDGNEQVLGLFAPVGLPKMIDRTEEVPSLGEMTTSAIERLKRDKDGFFLMVEGSQIDWAGHDNDIVSAMSDMEDFEKAFNAAIEFAKKDKHTLVIATADHQTGGMALGSGGPYNWFPESIKAAERTPDFMAAEIADGAGVEETLDQYIELDLTDEETQAVRNAEGKGVTEIDNAIEDIFTDRSRTGWTTGGHDGVDVPVYAYGPRSNWFAGKIDNTDVGNNIFRLLEKGSKADYK